MLPRRTAGIDAELGIAAVARRAKGGVAVEVAARGRPGDVAGLAREVRVSEKQVVLGLGGPQVFLRAMKLPGELDLKAVAETVKWQLADVIPDREIRHAATGRLEDCWCVIVGGVPKELVRGVSAGALDLRAAALWRGAVHLLGEEGAGPLAAVERSPSGWRVVAGRQFMEFAREISADAEPEVQRTLLYCRSEMGDDLRVVYVGQDLPEETAAVGLALHHALEPRFNFLVRERRGGLALPAGKQLARLAAVGIVAALLPHVAAWAYRAQAAEWQRRADALAPQARQYASLKAEREKYQDWAAIVDSFAVTPAWPLMDDLRRAVPEKVWLTAARTERPAQAPAQAARPGRAAAAPTGVRTAGNAPASAPTEARTAGSGPAAPGGAGRAPVQPAAQLPERPSGVALEGYSLDAASVGLLRDNLEALPWSAGVSSVVVEWNEEAGAFNFKLTVAVKQPERGGGRK